MMHDVCCMSHRSSFWHRYMITYCNFMVIVEPCLYLYTSTVWTCKGYCCHTRLVLLVATWMYARQTAEMGMKDFQSFTCCLFWTLGSSSKCSQLKFFSSSTSLVDVHLICFNWCHFLTLVGGLLVTLIGCIILISLFFIVIRMPFSIFFPSHG